MRPVKETSKAAAVGAALLISSSIICIARSLSSPEMVPTE
jgi:hypothetical protein